MHFPSSSSIVLLPVALSAVASASPMKFFRRQSGAWPVTNFDYGCSPGGCVYNFQVNSPTIDGESSSVVNTNCTGPISGEVNYGPPLTCTEISTEWKLVDNLVNDVYVTSMYVSHLWETQTGTHVCVHNTTASGTVPKDGNSVFLKSFDLDTVTTTTDGAC